MSTTSLPSRTRSIRKPAVDTGLGNGTESRLRNGLSIDTRAAAAAPAPRLRSAAFNSAGAGDVSPTRLPARSTSSKIVAPSNGTETSLRRNPSIKPRPTSMYGSTSGTNSIRPPSRDGAMRPPPRPSSKDGSMRPPPRPTTSRVAAGALNPDGTKAVSRPPMASDTYKISTRTTARTSADSSTSTSTSTSGIGGGISRQQSTRLTRASSTSTGSSSTGIPGSPRGHTRNASSITNLNSNTFLRHPSVSSHPQKAPESPTSDTSSHTTSRRQLPDPRLNRPTFSTLQQHYSPAKYLAPKPTTASILAPGSPSKLPSNIAISAETAKLQAELLQLHLLHREAAGVERQFRNSAKRKLEHRFKEVGKKHEDLVGIEEAQADRATALVLKAWAENEVQGFGFDERVQVLDEVVAGLWNLSDPGGKYYRVVRRFEKWINHVMEVHSRREKGDMLDDGEVIFIDELENQWRDELRSQSRKAENLKDKLDDLGEVEGKSSLASVIKKFRDLAKGMMMELDTMKKTEAEVVKGEQDWIRGMIKDPDVEEDPRPTAGAVWRRM